MKNRAKIFAMFAAGILLSGMCFPAVASASDTGGEGEEYPKCVIEPPAGSEIEQWEFCYDYYPVCIEPPSSRDKLSEYKTNFVYVENPETGDSSIEYDTFEIYLDCVRPVDCVKDGNDIYFRGVSVRYPQLWIKGEIVGDAEVCFERGQISGYVQVIVKGDQHVVREYEFVPSFIYVKKDEEPFGHAHTFYHVNKEKDQPALVCTYNAEEEIIEMTVPEVEGLEGNGDYGFFMRESPAIYSEDYLGTIDDYHPDWPDEWKPLEVDVYVNVSFRKAKVGSVGMGGTDMREGDGIVYDLSGRRVNAERLAPGIYIRDGKKFVVRR